MGCAWTDRSCTLCSSCDWLDQAVRNKAGRRALAQAIQDYGVEGLVGILESSAKATRQGRAHGRQ